MKPEENQAALTERLAYAERKADELMASRLEDMKILTEQAQITMTITVAAMSAVFGYAVQLVRPLALSGLKHQDWEMLTPTLVLAAHLTFTAYELLKKCMLVQDFSPPGQMPSQLVGSKANYPDDFLTLRHAELLSVARRIDANADRNDRTAAGLNKARTRLIFAPVVFFAGFVVQAIAGALV